MGRFFTLLMGRFFFCWGRGFSDNKLDNLYKESIIKLAKLLDKNRKESFMKALFFIIVMAITIVGSMLCLMYDIATTPKRPKVNFPV